VRKAEDEWQVYRTRFLLRAKQLTRPLEFRDALGLEHRGQSGDYLIESSDGTQRIAPREIFEDIYVSMGSGVEKWPSLAYGKGTSTRAVNLARGQHPTCQA